MREWIPRELIEKKIYRLRNHNVMLDRDLAKLYGVKAIRLREQVKRNPKRFPEDFMFQLNKRETSFMVSHFAIPSKKHLGGFRPYVFTEQGVAMLSTVLNSDRAIEVNIIIMRTFVRIRRMLSSHTALSNKLKELEQKYEKHDEEIQAIFTAIRKLMATPYSFPKPKRQIGFHSQV